MYLLKINLYGLILYILFQVDWLDYFCPVNRIFYIIIYICNVSVFIVKSTTTLLPCSLWSVWNGHFISCILLENKSFPMYKHDLKTFLLEYHIVQGEGFISRGSFERNTVIN